ncbi:methyltransferase domain-containing protein [Kriegella sp. EG-1]|nr:methyltransferase domain-containing protein [Flavobacteriaceae bacterium EG-1]
MKNRVKLILGNILIELRPKKVSYLEKNGITLNIGGEYNLCERLMCFAMLKNAERKGNSHVLQEYHKNFWINKGREHFLRTEDVLEGYFIPRELFLFDKLQEKLNSQWKGFHSMVEIGTGNGYVLDFLSTRFSQINKFIGIDLSQSQIKINKKRFLKNKKLEFVAMDGLDWVRKNGRSNMIFFTSGGVLEYFSEQRLKELLTVLNNLGHTILVFVEPIAVDIDFTENQKSQAYGYESSFSHDYARLLKEAGFKLWHESSLPYKPKEYFFAAIGAIN